MRTCWLGFCGWRRKIRDDGRAWLSRKANSGALWWCEAEMRGCDRKIACGKGGGSRGVARCGQEYEHLDESEDILVLRIFALFSASTLI
ncbi:hypothetical protein L1987_86062 [Smallanthus sonchifolius]|uniref:Uncharacterized protein n=1 Tax=Smallanthus sonchifolius TaxID=185202 RepID=A0ACB8XYZ0_9ASTR|nr:hypothetical protein L1987_86062 [Smallanthus sonchifolius]